MDFYYKAVPRYLLLICLIVRYILLSRSWSLTKFHHIHIRLERTVNATLLACRYIGDLLVCISGAGEGSRSLNPRRATVFKTVSYTKFRHARILNYQLTHIKLNSCTHLLAYAYVLLSLLTKCRSS